MSSSCTGGAWSRRADELRAAHSSPGQGLASLTDALINLTEGELS